MVKTVNYVAIYTNALGSLVFQGRPHALPCCVLHIPQPEVEWRVWGRGGTETTSLSWWKATVFPTVNLYTYLQCALWGLVQTKRSVHLWTVMT